MKNRPIIMSDIPVLQMAIDADTFHPGKWKVEDFKGFSEVIEDHSGPVVFVVYAPEGSVVGRLRISTVWVTPEEVHRNGRAIVFLVREAARRARLAGFNELIFTTTYDKLARFCHKVLGFESIGGDEYVLDITEESR